MIQNLVYELTILARAVQHKNLSAASVHIGLSQPQLSRMISKLESVLKVVLLDRSARRKSGWTPFAHELAVTFSKGIGRLETEVSALTEEREINELRIGTLEGLSLIACSFAKTCFEQLHMKTVFLDVLDFKDLDSQFIGGELDLIFTVRAPSKQKYQHLIEVGYQQMEKVTTDHEVHVISPFEYSADIKQMIGPKKALVSNSLSVRQHWLTNLGGTGTLPTEAKKGKGKGYYTILLIGSELLSPRLWSSIEKNV